MRFAPFSVYVFTHLFAQRICWLPILSRHRHPMEQLLRMVSEDALERLIRRQSSGLMRVVGTREASSACLVASRPDTGYAARMSRRTHTWLASPMGQFTRALMLVLGILSVPSVGPAAMQRPHSTQHERSGIHGDGHSGMHQVPEPTHSTSWDGATQHECPHCPVTECARVSPCSASSNAAISEASLTVSDPDSDRVSGRRVRVHPYSATHQPPTPPPQLIS